jgi:O-antigen/teichoic acid export membrane protein
MTLEHFHSRDHGEHKPSEVVNSLYTIGLAVVGFIVNYLLNIILARHLSAASYGDFSVVIRVVTLCATIGLFGVNVSVVRFLPAYLSQAKATFAHGLLRWNLRIVSIVTLSITLLGAILATTLVIMDKLGYTELNNYHPVVFAFWLIPLYVYTLFFGKVLQSDAQPKLSLTTINIGSTALEIIFIFVAMFFYKTLSIYFILFMVGMAHMLIILFQLWATYRTTYHKVNQHKPEYESKQWLTYSIEMLANNIILYLGISINLVMLEILGKREEDVGIFAAILTIQGIVFLINRGINTIVLPKISANIGDISALQKVLNKSNLMQLLISLPVMILVLVYSKNILAMFNPQFTTATLSLDISMVTAFISLLFSFCGSLLLYSGFEKVEIKINIAFVAISVAFNFILIPKYQLLGAAIAMNLSTFISYILDYVVCKRKIAVKPLFFI